MFNMGFGKFNDTTPVVKNLIIINVLFFLATWVLKTYQIDLYDHFGLHYFTSPLFKPIQLITHMFMHGNLPHLFFNMFALWMFGKILESVWGSQRFFIYYIITGLGAAAVHTLVNYIQYSHIEATFQAFSNSPSSELYVTLFKKYLAGHVDPANYFGFNYSPSMALQKLYDGLAEIKNAPTVGASGAVFGILLAFGMLFPNTELMLLFPPIPIKAKWFVLGYGAIELYLGLAESNSNIAHFAHLGGMIFGFILIKYWNSKRTNFY